MNIPQLVASIIALSAPPQPSKRSLKNQGPYAFLRPENQGYTFIPHQGRGISSSMRASYMNQRARRVKLGHK